MLLHQLAQTKPFYLSISFNGRPNLRELLPCKMNNFQDIEC